MSITVISQPYIRSFLKNKIPYVLQTDNYVTAAGSAAFVELRILPIATNTLTIAWGDTSLDFVCGTVDNSGLKIAAYPGSNPDGYQDTLIANLKSNKTLYDNFLIESYIDGTDTWVRITARENGTDYNIDVAYDGTGSINLAIPGVNKTVNENFKIKVELIIFNGNGLEEIKLIELEQIPNDDSKVIFEMQEYIDKYFTTLLPDMPAFNSDEIAITENMIRKYYIRFYESYGDPELNYFVTGSDIRYVINGGIKMEDWPGNTLLASLATDTKRFLTWHPLHKTINTTQQEYLYYYLSTDLDLLQIYVRVTYSGGSTAQGVAITQEGASAHNIFILPVGYDQLGIAETYLAPEFLPEGEHIVKYDVWVVNQSEVALSEERTFVLDDIDYENERFFLYKTSLAGFDTLRTYESAKKSTSVDYDISERFISNDYTAATGQRKKSNVTFNDDIEVSMGLLDKDTKQAMQDFIVSEEVFQIYPDRFVSIEIQNKDQQIYDEEEDLHPLILKYKINFTNSGFSNL